MSREQVDYVIDGTRYVFTQMDPKNAARIAIRIMKVLGTPLGGAIGALDLDSKNNSKAEPEINMDLLGKAIGSLFDNVDEDEAIDTFEKLLRVVIFEAKPLNMDGAHFNGRPLHLMKVVQKSAEVNFADFFGEGSIVRNTISKMMASMRAKSVSTSLSGESS